MTWTDGLHARFHYVVAVFEEEQQESSVVLKLDLRPYVEIGAIFVPLALTKRRLVAQTGIDMVCGPEEELCVCYHNGHELPHGDEVFTNDGDFFVCWIDDEPPQASGVVAESDSAAPPASEWLVTVEFNCSPVVDSAGDNRQ